jgi:Ca2+-binding EF-hand superfamily protein
LSLFGNFIDHDGEMKLAFEEFVAMQPVRIRELHTRETLREWYEAADEDHSGKLTINEFFKWSLSSRKVDGATTLESIFRKYDVDNSGTIGKDEFKRMAFDLGFGHMAHEAFAVLDKDRSGSITYREVLDALHFETPFNLEVKKFLFGAIWAWGAEDKSVKGLGTKPGKVSTRGWRIKGSEVDEVLDELRALLNASGADISDLAKM